jgi:hypothetical protein
MAMEQSGREHWGELGKLLDEIAESGENIIIDTDGKFRLGDGTAKANCLVTYVNCRTKVTEMQSLTPGETFCYGDWDGTTCVRKTYTC